MKQIKKIIQIILVFFIALLFISFVWYGINTLTSPQKEASIPFIDYVLYMLGFGDLNVADHYMQTAFSVLGLFAVTLLSSVFTVSLFELRSKVKLAQHILVVSETGAELALHTSGKDVYHLTATMISKCGDEITTLEQYFPFVGKKESLNLRYEIAPGTPIYKYLRGVYTHTPEKKHLILTVSYTDIESGQVYSMAQKYLWGGDEKGFVFAAPEEKVQQKILQQTFRVNLAGVWPCEAEDIDLSYGYQQGDRTWQQNEAFVARVHMTGKEHYEPGNFTMAVATDLLGNDWTKYYDLGCALKFACKVQGDIALTMELKYGDKCAGVLNHKFLPSDEFENFVLHLQELDREKLKHVEELCFTVFYRDVDVHHPVGEFVIRDCVLEVSNR